MKPLLLSLQLGSLKLKNRIVLAPLTRCRASGPDDRTPNQLMAEYYKQRTSAGLILTEATSISPLAVGYPRTPGIWSQEHVTGWKNIVDTVHKNDGIIFLQLWHVGRVSDPMYLSGNLPLAPSAVAAEGHVRLVRPEKPHVVPREMTEVDIKKTIAEYQLAAANAKRAGFDGVEIHGANEYLIEQFLHPASNFRTDKYGGSLENRMRFLLEVVDAILTVWPADRVGLHLAPGSGLSLKNPEKLKTFVSIAHEMKKRKLSFLFVRETQSANSILPNIKKEFEGCCIANDSLDFATAEKIIAEGSADAVSFGKPFIANPDLVERYRDNLILNSPDSSTFYSHEAEGYTDYPLLFPR